MDFTYIASEDRMVLTDAKYFEETHKLDTTDYVRFYEQEFYCLSNFSSFRVEYEGVDFDTSEHAYHWCKFPDNHVIQSQIRNARSAHDAFKIAESNKIYRRQDWDSSHPIFTNYLIKDLAMRAILHEKVMQHEYVAKKLKMTGERLLIEDSWRDDYWGWGPHQTGSNRLGVLWMEVRKQLFGY